MRAARRRSVRLQRFSFVAENASTLKPKLARGAMSISDIPIFSMLRTRMQWHQERQQLLSENVSNANTPDFRPRDLAPLDLTRPQTGGALAVMRTNPLHLSAATTTSAFQLDHRSALETSPKGNAVTLEDEMLKVAANQMDYQAATALYARSLSLIKTALGRG
jgi:flagellar basal-body rod protein FlgB